jgi:hypothetical protein
MWAAVKGLGGLLPARAPKRAAAPAEAEAEPAESDPATPPRSASPAPAATKRRLSGAAAAKAAARAARGGALADEGANLVGAVLRVPAAVFKVDAPGRVFLGDVLRLSKRRPGCVDVRFRDDGMLCWFEAADARRWRAAGEGGGNGKRRKTAP